ncbi:MAG: hypothetical protein IPL23_27650 [Saprospiraceae bacterium]|nr:hypothetical protein [Saprospiraceae bacterium]
MISGLPNLFGGMFSTGLCCCEIDFGGVWMGFKDISTMLCGLPNLFGGMFFLRTEVRSPLGFVVAK